MWKENESLSKHTSFHVGGVARFYFEARSVAELLEALSEAKKQNLKIAILGGGTNSLFSDNGFDGMVIRPMMNAVKIDDDGTVRAEAGATSTFVARQTAERGLTGLEWMATLPGTIGGAVRGNAGCFGSETKDHLVHVELVRGNEVIMIDQNRCRFAYRESAFKSLSHDNVIISATFQLQKSDRESCLEKIEGNIRKRQATQPLGTSSAGCVFKNYTFLHEAEVTKLREHREVPTAFLASRMIPAGWLIEQAELKGFCVGGACVSEKHGNFMISKPGTTADQIIQLVAVIKTRVRDKFGIQLQEEVEFFT